MSHLPPLPLPAGIRARTIDDVNGLRMHVLEAGDPRQRLVLLLHGFPELAYSWRKVMPELADAGYHVVAPDQRGYGRTAGWAKGYDTDLGPFRLLNLARDAFGLVRALGHDHVACVVGHDFGSSVAAWSAQVRPDVFHSVVLMSAPFAGPPPLHAPVEAQHLRHLGEYLLGHGAAQQLDGGLHDEAAQLGEAAQGPIAAPGRTRRPR